MNIRHNALPAAALSVSLLAGACSGETPEPQDTHTVPPVPVFVEQPPAYPPVKMNDLDVRIIQAEDPSSRAAGVRHAANTGNIIGLAGQLAAQSTNDQWQLRSGGVERVTLKRRASRDLCAVRNDAATWSTILKDVQHDVMEAAGEPANDYDTTIISYGFNTCQPISQPDNPDQRIAVMGEPAQQAKVINFTRGLHSAKFVLHQFGHYYGLGHARLNTCDQDGAGAFCFDTDKVYADPSNVMGNTTLPDQDVFNSPQLARTEVLDPNQIIDVKKNGEFTLGSLVGGSDYPRVLRIKADGHHLPGPQGQEYYYVELSGDTSGRSRPGVSLKVYRATDVQDPPQVYPSTVLYKLGKGAEVGATRPRKQPVFQAAGGLRIMLKALNRDRLNDAGGTARVAVELPD